MATKSSVVSSFLTDLNLSELSTIFLSQGYEDLLDILRISKTDLTNINIMDHQQEIILNAGKLKYI